MFTAHCTELDVANCGHTSEEAKKNLEEVSDTTGRNSQARDGERFFESF